MKSRILSSGIERVYAYSHIPLKAPPPPPRHTYWRPTSRRDCQSVPRPCPFVGCRYNTATDSNGVGFVDIIRDVDDCHPRQSCVLDIQAAGPITNKEYASLMRVSRQAASIRSLKAVRRFMRGLLQAGTSKEDLAMMATYFRSRLSRKTKKGKIL